MVDPSARLNTKTIGVVVDKLRDANEDISKEELPYSKEEILEILQKKFEMPSKEGGLGQRATKWVVASEHGKDKEHHHFQCFFQFEKQVRTRKGHFVEHNLAVPLKILFEHPKKNAVALERYCKKEGDYTTNIKDKEEKGFLAQMIKSKTPTEGIKDIIESRPEILINGDVKRILRNLETFKEIQEEVPMSTHFKFPMYMVDDPKYEIIHKWFKANCIENPMRKKALVIFSNERGMGKTMFAKSLVDDDDRRYIICRNTFCEGDFKKPHAQLLILDDMTYIDKQKEMWKALASGEQTSVRDAYCNTTFKHGLPCIITTNQYKMFDFMLESTHFKNDCYFFKVDEYMGPPGTNPASRQEPTPANFNIKEYLAEQGRKKVKTFTDNLSGFECNQSLGMARMWGNEGSPLQFRTPTPSEESVGHRYVQMKRDSMAFKGIVNPTIPR